MLRRLPLLWFLDFTTAYSHFNFQICSYFIVGNKIFCLFKKWVVFFFGRGYISSWGRGRLGKKRVRSIFQGEDWYPVGNCWIGTTILFQLNQNAPFQGGDLWMGGGQKVPYLKPVYISLNNETWNSYRIKGNVRIFRKLK